MCYQMPFFSIIVLQSTLSMNRDKGDDDSQLLEYFYKVLTWDGLGNRNDISNIVQQEINLRIWVGNP